jgi:hypothetical protein
MPENRIDATLTPAERAAILDDLRKVRTRLPFLTDLSPEQRRSYPKLGDTSLPFALRALEVARLTPDILPRRFDVEAFARDVELAQALEAVRLEVNRLAEHVEDTRLLVGSEAYAGALAVYRAVRDSPTGEGLDDVADELARRFARKSRPDEAPAG